MSYNTIHIDLPDGHTIDATVRECDWRLLIDPPSTDAQDEANRIGRRAGTRFTITFETVPDLPGGSYQIRQERK